MKKVAVILAEGFEEIEAITPIDLLLRAGISIVPVGVDKTKIKGAHGFSVNLEILVDSLKDDLDGVVIPGGLPGAENIAKSPAAKKVINRVWKEGGMVAAICAAPGLVLGPMGILAGKNATCYPGFEGNMTGAKPSSRPVVTDGSIITSKGPGTAFAFSLEIIRFLCGDAKAEEIRKATQYGK